MFANTSAFQGWLQQQAAPALLKQTDNYSTGEWNRLMAIYKQYGRPKNPGDMMQLSQTIGTAIPQFLKLAGATGLAMDSPSAKQFVIDNAVSLFHLIDRGPDGTEKRVVSPEGMDLSSIMPGGLVESFVRPMATQGVEESVKMLRRLGKLK